jgi:hypothetical protein
VEKRASGRRQASTPSCHDLNGSSNSSSLWLQPAATATTITMITLIAAVVVAIAIVAWSGGSKHQIAPVVVATIGVVAWAG